MIQKYHAWFLDLLYRPARVFWFCVCLAATGVVLDGSALRLWSLNRDHRDLSRKITEARAHAKLLEFRIQQASLPGFIERQARDQFDLVKEGDLVFVFSGGEAE